MKKILYYAVICLILLGYSQFSVAQQLYGKWVVPISFEGGTNYAYQIIFTDASVSWEQIIPTPSIGSGVLAFSAGGYNANYDLNFSFLGNYLCFGNSTTQWITGWGLKSEFQIIKVP
ncbi:MAG: hypothetical protein WC341_12140 [Bacteroidales bacterium]